MEEEEQEEGLKWDKPGGYFFQLYLSGTGLIKGIELHH